MNAPPPEPVVVLVQHFPFLAAIRMAKAARAAGFTPVVIGPANAPVARVEELGVQVVTTEDWSREALERIVTEIGSRAPVAGILSTAGLFTGQGLLAAHVAEIARERGLPYAPPSSLWRANNKYLMRRRLEEAGVYTVRYALAEDAGSLRRAYEHVRFPLVVKPICGIGSSFIYRCGDAGEAQAALAHYQANASSGYYRHVLERHRVGIDGVTFDFDPTRQVLVEEAIDGRECSVECLCDDADVRPLLVHDKLDVEQAAYCSFENLLIVPPIRLSAAEAAEVRTYARDVVRALGLRNAFCHVELRIDALGRPSVMEVNPRIGGMRVIDSLRDLCGVDYGSAMIRIAAGLPIDVPEPCRIEGYRGMMAVYPRRSGTIAELSGVERAAAIPGVLDIKSYFTVGDEVGGDFEEVFVIDAGSRAGRPGHPRRRPPHSRDRLAGRERAGVTARNGRLLIPARFVSDFGAFMSVVAVSTFAYSLSHDPLVLGLVLALRVAGGILAGMVATPFFRRARGAVPLVVLDLSRSAALVVLLLLPGGPTAKALCAVSFVLGFGGSLFSIGLNAQLVRLVGEGRLLSTNAWLSSVASVAIVLGSVSSGWIVALGGFRLAFEINAVTYVVAGILIAGLRFAAPASPRASDPARPAAATLRAAVQAAPALGFMLVVMFADTLGSAAHNVGFPILSALISPASAAWVMGLLLATWACGKFAGAWLAKQYGRAADDGGFQTGFFAGVLVMSACFVTTFFQHALAPALAWIALAGLGDGVSEVCFRTRLQRADEDVQIPMFSATSLAQNVGFAAGMLLCAPFFGWWSPGRVLLLFHGTPILIAALGLVLWRRDRRPLTASAEYER